MLRAAMRERIYESFRCNIFSGLSPQRLCNDIPERCKLLEFEPKGYETNIGGVIALVLIA
jgi:hypothetical protein